MGMVVKGVAELSRVVGWNGDWANAPGMQGRVQAVPRAASPGTWRRLHTGRPRTTILRALRALWVAGSFCGSD